MARLPRLVVPDYPHHLTQRGVRSMDIFTGDEDRVAYLAFIAEECRRHAVEVLAWCLMTNHVHFIAVPKIENSLARAFGETCKRAAGDDKAEVFGWGIPGPSMIPIIYSTSSCCFSRSWRSTRPLRWIADRLRAF